MREVRSEASDIFRHHFGFSTNVITPNVVIRQMFGKFAVEISAGTWMDGQKIYGVTVIEQKGHDPADSVRRHDLSTAKWSYEDAMEYAKSLRREEADG